MQETPFNINEEINPGKNISQESYRLPFILAIGLHVLLLIILFIHFNLLPYQQPAVQSSTAIINAVTVSQGQLQNQLDQIQAQKQAQLQAQRAAAQQQAIAQQKQQEEQIAQAKAVLQQRRIQAQKQAAQQAAKQQAQAQQQAEQRVAQQKAAELAVQQAAQAAAAKAAKAKAVAEKAAEAKAAQKATQATADALQKQKALAKQAQEKALAKQMAQQMLQQAVASSAQAQAAEAQASAVNQGVIDKYKALIIQAISQQWIVPDTTKKDEQAKLLVHLAPGGVVLSVQIIESSGDPILDRSAQTAVMKASPLPVPADPTQFASFRDINLIVRPEGIVTGS